MASKRNSYRNQGNRDNRDNRGNTKHSRHQPSGNSKSRVTQYVCDVCGTSLPKYGRSVPMCPRCMIPMGQVRGSVRKNGKKKYEFDYSARIYYQTDGHPQYKGLPVDHPDPDDEELVQKYKEKRERLKKEAKASSQEKRSSKPKRGRNTGQRREYVKHRRPDNRDSGKNDAKAVVQESPDRSDHQANKNDTKKSEQKQPEQSKDKARKKPFPKPRRPQRKRALNPEPRTDAPKTQNAHLNEAEYAGTALSTTDSTASILSQSLESKPSSSYESGTVLSDYNSNSKTSPDSNRSE